VRLNVKLPAMLIAIAAGSVGSLSEAADWQPGYSRPMFNADDQYYFGRTRREFVPDYPVRGARNPMGLNECGPNCNCPGGGCNGQTQQPFAPYRPGMPNRFPSVRSPGYGTSGQCADPSCGCSQGVGRSRYPMVFPDVGRTPFAPPSFNNSPAYGPMNRSPYFE